MRTIDELKPVRCGCGGEAVTTRRTSFDYYTDVWYIGCKECHISTDEYYTEAEAIEAWNRAMGTEWRLQWKAFGVDERKRDDLTRVERTAKVVVDTEPERKTFHVIDRQTGREADPYDIALNEDWAKSLMYCDMEGFALLEDGTLILTDECGRYEFPPDSDRFEIVWD